MQAGMASIGARSKRHAMDWSLVLASQGVEVIIEEPTEEHGWVLLVEPNDYPRALEAIRLYRVENRRWRWRQNLEWSGVTFHWGALVWCAALVFFYWLQGATAGRVELDGIMHGLSVKQGQWWRLVTAICLHADLAHLAANVSVGFLVMGLAMGRYGAGLALLATLLCGAAGNIGGLIFHEADSQGLGASGAITGGLGLLAVQSFSVLRRARWAWKEASTGLLAGLLLFILVGLEPSSDVVAHVGGFLCGLVLGAALALLPTRLSLNPWVGRVTMLAALAIMTLCWILALR